MPPHLLGAGFTISKRFGADIAR
uniref:Uncharacterized protein n=1 Tax=Romanomermis culicivorax TaxID=13658 RepID=A0A915KYI1_ROMCU